MSDPTARDRKQTPEEIAAAECRAGEMDCNGDALHSTGLCCNCSIHIEPRFAAAIRRERERAEKAERGLEQMELSRDIEEAARLLPCLHSDFITPCHERPESDRCLPCRHLPDIIAALSVAREEGRREERERIAKLGESKMATSWAGKIYRMAWLEIIAAIRAGEGG